MWLWADVAVGRVVGGLLLDVQFAGGAGLVKLVLGNGVAKLVVAQAEHIGGDFVGAGAVGPLRPQQLHEVVVPEGLGGGAAVERRARHRHIVLERLHRAGEVILITEVLQVAPRPGGAELREEPGRWIVGVSGLDAVAEYHPRPLAELVVAQVAKIVESDSFEETGR